MAFDWSLVVGTLVGASIGLAGDWTGRRSARRQAEEIRRRTLEDARIERAATWEHERLQRIEGWEHDALVRLLAAMHTLPGIGEIESDESGQSARSAIFEFCRLLSNTWPHIIDRELRTQIRIADGALDLALSGMADGYRVSEVVYITRYALRESVGARLRGADVIPLPSEDWKRLQAATLAGIERFKQDFRRPGFDAFTGTDLESTA